MLDRGTHAGAEVSLSEGVNRGMEAKLQALCILVLVAASGEIHAAAY
jgi:hypothetical protein